MKLAAESQLHIEEFFREYFREDKPSTLPPILIYSGRCAALLTGMCRAGAITFGRRVFVAPTLVSRDGSGRLVAPGNLLVHEATHVRQYTEMGMIRFFITYLGGYWRALQQEGKGKKRWRDSEVRHRAYLAITEERIAYAAEDAFLVWAARPNQRAVQKGTTHYAEKSTTHYAEKSTAHYAEKSTAHYAEKSTAHHTEKSTARWGDRESANDQRIAAPVVENRS